MSQLSAHRLASALGACVLIAARAWGGEGPTARTQALVQALQGDAATLRERLERLEPRPVPDLLALALAGRIPADWSAGALELTPEAHACVLAVLRGTEFRRLEAPLAELAAGAAGWDARATAMSLLENAAQPEALRLLIALARAPDAAPAPRDLRERYVALLRRLLANDPGSLAALHTELARIPPGLVNATFDALDGQPPEAVLELVARTLGRVSALDSLLLLLAARHAVRAEPPFDPHVQARVRAYLAHAEPALQSLAAKACGVLDDDQAVPGLIDLLESGDPNLRRSARTALECITELGFQESVDAWERWYLEELEWWSAESSADLDAVRSGQASAAARALGAIATRRLHRDELALGLGEMLVFLDEERALMACGVLQHLGSRGAREGLERSARQHASAAVRERAGEVLERLAARPRGSVPGGSR